VLVDYILVQQGSQFGHQPGVEGLLQFEIPPELLRDVGLP
jgi:hypothetical protein